MPSIRSHGGAGTRSCWHGWSQRYTGQGRLSRSHRRKRKRGCKGSILLPWFVDPTVFIRALWDGGSGRSSCFLGACFASCRPALSPRAPNGAPWPTAGYETLCDCHGPLTVSLSSFSSRHVFEHLPWFSFFSSTTSQRCFGEHGALKCHRGRCSTSAMPSDGWSWNFPQLSSLWWHLGE